MSPTLCHNICIILWVHRTNIIQVTDHFSGLRQPSCRVALGFKKFRTSLARYWAIIRDHIFEIFSPAFIISLLSRTRRRVFFDFPRWGFNCTNDAKR